MKFILILLNFSFCASQILDNDYYDIRHLYEEVRNLNTKDNCKRH